MAEQAYEIIQEDGYKIRRTFRLAMYKGKIAAQHLDFDIVLKPFLEHHQFEAIIEIGTASGGLTYFFHDILPNAQITTYEIRDREKLKNLFLDDLPNVTYKNKNVFSEEYSSIDENYPGRRPLDASIVDQEFIDLLHTDKKLAVFCDGHNKKAEVRCIAPHLKVGDMILFHDYCIDEKEAAYFKESSTWSSIETMKSYVEQPLLDNGFEFVHPELRSVMWGCAVKVK